MIKPSCPYCGSEDVHCEYVDNGVGMQQVTPYGCERCHAVEIGPYDKPDKPLTEKEKKTGWYEPRIDITKEK